MHPKNKFETRVSILLNERVTGDIKHFIQIDKNTKIMGDWSGWYLPKENTLIFFEYAGHSRFMWNYWPSKSPLLAGDEKAEWTIKETNSKLNPIVKKYKKKVLANYNKGDVNAHYEDFYNIGWVRVNIERGKMAITFNSANQEGVKNFILWASDTGLKVKQVRIFDQGSKVVTDLTQKEFETFANTVNAGDVGGDLIDKVRTKMFGPNFYVDDFTFDKYIKAILETSAERK